MNADHSEVPQNTLPPRRPSPLWLIAPLLAALIFVLLRRPTPPEIENTAPFPTAAPTLHSATVKPTTASSVAAKPKPIQLVLFVPDDNGRLQRKSVASNLPPFQPGNLANPQQRAGVQAKAATLALERLMQQAPDDFPKGAKLRAPVVLRDGVAHIDFNSNFADPNFWQGSTRILASTQAIVQTVAGTARPLGAAKNMAVQLMTDGKPLETLGDLDVSEPLQPDDKMASGH